MVRAPNAPESGAFEGRWDESEVASNVKASLTVPTETATVTARRCRELGIARVRDEFAPSAPGGCPHTSGGECAPCAHSAYVSIRHIRQRRIRQHTSAYVTYVRGALRALGVGVV